MLCEQGKWRKLVYCSLLEGFLTNQKSVFVKIITTEAPTEFECSSAAHWERAAEIHR